MSKPLFAYVTMFLVEEGKLDLDKPISDYLDSQYHHIFDYDVRYDQITARMVLSHTTGFPNWRGDGDLIIQFDPGTNFSYSGEGYQYLVHAMELILNTGYNGMESYYQEKVAGPLNMKFTKYIQDEYNFSQKATAYRNGEKLPLDHRGGEFSAAAGIYSEAVDYSKWIVALIEGKGLSKKSYDALFTDQITISEAPSMLKEEGAIAWTLGFAKFEISDKIIHGHLGNNDGYSSLFLLDRDKKWGLVLFTNADQAAEKFGFDLFKYLNQSK